MTERDFTLEKYKELLSVLMSAGYSFQTFADYVTKPLDRIVILRHDVDAKKNHSLRFAKIQNELGIKGTYYFRVIPQSFDEEVIRQIAEMGHEIGYHYEDMDFAKGDVKRAKELFESHLLKLRNVSDIKTLCMHGSPMSKFDNREIWKHYDYREYGLIAEPYFDMNFSEVLYLTDTGRRWDGSGVSVRDKAPSEEVNKFAKKDVEPLSSNYHFSKTSDIIKAAQNGELPDRIMMNFHPQRWTNNPVEWIWELGFQRLKNVAKKAVVKARN